MGRRGKSVTHILILAIYRRFILVYTKFDKFI